MTDNAAVRRLRGLRVGTRVVVRYRIPGGLTDALGELIRIDDNDCIVRTRRHGDVTIALAEVALAKPVPPPPARRDRPAPGPRPGRSGATPEG